MRARFHLAIRRALTALTDLACRRPRAVVGIALAAAAIAAWYVATNLTIDTSTARMLSEDLRYRQLHRVLDEVFPQEADQLIVVVEGENPDLVAEAADVFVDVLRNRPDLYRSVFDPRTDPFFRRNGLLYATVDDLESLSDRLATAQPFLGALWQDPSLRGFFEMLRLAAENAGNPADETLDIGHILDSVAAVAEAEAEGRFARLSWIRLMTGAMGDGVERRLIIVQPVLDYGRLRPAKDPIETIQLIADDLGYDGRRDVRVRLTGGVALKDDELQSVTVGMSTAGALSLALVVVLLLVGLRSPRTAAASMITLLVGLIYTAAFAVAAIGSLNLISVAFAVLFIGLSVDFSIHFALRFREEWEHNRVTCTNLHATVNGIGGALSLAAVAAAIGFVSFVPTEYTGLAELGIISAAGMLVALIVNLTVLPALIMLIAPRFTRPVRWQTDWQSQIADAVSRHARAVAAVAAVLGIGAAVLLPRAHFDFDPLNLKDPESPSVSTLLDLMADDPRQGYAAIYVAEDVADAERLARSVARSPLVAEARTLRDFVPEDQEEKREIIETLALILEPALTAPRLPPPTREETETAKIRLVEALDRLAAEGDPETATSARRLAAALAAVDRRSETVPDVWKQLEGALLAGLSRRLEDLRDSLRPASVEAADLPAPILERWLAPDGRARLEIYPRDPIHRDRAAMRAFLDDVRAVVPDAIGAPVQVYEGGQAVVRAFVQAAAIAVVAITVMLLILIRSVRVTLVIFSPLVLAALFTVAASVIFGIPFNFANVIVLPLLFGLGVAGSLHIVLRQRASEDQANVLSTSTPRAVLFSALTTIASFVSLNLSDHPGTASMGLLLTIALILTMVCTLLVLPAVMALAGLDHSDHADAPAPS